jgi:tyrosine aminotransferase
MTYEEPVSTFAELSEHEDQVIFKCSGLTKKYLGPGWRMGWIILYASPARQAFYRPYLKGIFNVILMPNTIMQASVSEIINSPFNEPRVNECMSLMH